MSHCLFLLMLMVIAGCDDAPPPAAASTASAPAISGLNEANDTTMPLTAEFDEFHRLTSLDGHFEPTNEQ